MVTTASLITNAGERMCSIRVAGVGPGAMIRKQWLESFGFPPFPESRGPFLPISVFLYIFPIICLTGWSARSASAKWHSVSKEKLKSLALSLHKLADVSLNLSSVTLAPRLPLSPTVVSMSALFILHPLFSPFSHIQTRDGHSLVCCPSALLYQKGRPPLIWGSLIIPCRTGGPLIQPLLSLVSPRKPQHSPPPLSPTVLSSFSGCNCSTINRGGRRVRWGWGSRKGMATERKGAKCNFLNTLYCCIQRNKRSLGCQELHLNTDWVGVLKTTEINQVYNLQIKEYI